MTNAQEKAKVHKLKSAADILARQSNDVNTCPDNDATVTRTWEINSASMLSNHC